MVLLNSLPLARNSFALAAAILACCTGCGGQSEVPLFPVSGRVTVDGVPLTSGVVGLHADPDRGNGFKEIPWGNLDSAGNYTVYLHGRAGAPLGAYKVTVTLIAPPADSSAPLPNPKYQKVETTDQNIDVVESPDAGGYNLQLRH